MYYCKLSATYLNGIFFCSKVKFNTIKNMSAIHKFRITDCIVKEKDAKEIYYYCFSYANFEFDFEDWSDRLQLNIDNSIKIDFDKFFSALSENYNIKGISFFELVFKLYNDDFETLHQNNNIDQISNLVSAEALVWYHIFADLYIDGFLKFPLKELKIEIAQVEDGIVAFPQVSDMSFWDEQYREFLIRLLANVPSNDLFNFPIQNWFEKNEEELFGGPISMKTNSIIWGMKEEERILITDNNSWERYNHLWWNDLIQKNVQYKIENEGDKWIETLQEYPLEIVSVTALIHNSWFVDIEEFIKNKDQFDSTAYFTN